MLPRYLLGVSGAMISRTSLWSRSRSDLANLDRTSFYGCGDWRVVLAETVAYAVEGQRNASKGHTKARRWKLSSCRTCLGQACAPHWIRSLRAGTPDLIWPIRFQ